MRRKNDLSPLLVIVWVLIAVIAVQSYFLFIRKDRPSPPSPQVAVKPPRPKSTPLPVKPARSLPVSRKIAIVIDDWGYNSSHCSFIRKINAPVGVAIIPRLPFSRKVIECARESGVEPMLHLPIEPHSYQYGVLPEFTIKAGMSPAEVRRNLSQVLDEMPGVVGVNNHMGSKGTEDSAVMRTVLSELRKRGLFFVDSLTSERSVCSSVAADLKMKIGRRDVFLDNRNDRAHIERQFLQAASIARKHGFALVIGHDRVLTLQIIAEQVRKYSSEGFQFIKIRDYIDQYEHSRF
jgi:polysaccharide deacetylase 2 family uncharacterized protein YibQ